MSKWQPIETAPRDGRRVLVCSEGRHMFVAFWDSKYWGWRVSRDSVVAADPTHWQPLPDPPTGTERGLQS